MAKFGNMVGQYDIDITLEDKNQLSELFSGMLSQYTSEEFSKRIEESDGDEMHDGDRTMRVKCYYFYFDFPKPVKMRNQEGTLVELKSIYFDVQKETGFLDNWDWNKGCLRNPNRPKQDWEGAPEYQWSVDIRFKGRERRYRHRNWESIQMRSQVMDWDTDMNKLDFNRALTELFKSYLKPRQW